MFLEAFAIQGYVPLEAGGSVTVMTACAGMLKLLTKLAEVPIKSEKMAPGRGLLVLKPKTLSSLHVSSRLAQVHLRKLLSTLQDAPVDIQLQLFMSACGSEQGQWELLPVVHFHFYN